MAGHKPHEFIYDNWSKLNARTIGDLSKVLRKKGKGNQEIVYGIVKNFNWTSRDDGGFDCTTEIVSPASSVFGSPLGDSESTAAFEIPAELKNQIRDQRAYFKSRKEETKKIRDDEDIQKALAKQGLGSGGQEIDEHYIQNLPPKILFENLTELLINMKYRFSAYDPNTATASTDADVSEAGSFIIGENEKYKDTIIVQQTYEWQFSSNAAANFDEAYLGPYVTYGWFEDNILNSEAIDAHTHEFIAENTVDYLTRSETFIVLLNNIPLQAYDTEEYGGKKNILYTIDYSNFFEKDSFIIMVKDTLTRLGFEYKIDISDIHNKFIEKLQPFIQSERRVKQAFAAWLNKEYYDLSNLLLIEKACLSYYIEDHLGYEVETWLEYPKNTQDLNPIKAWEGVRYEL